MHQCNTMPFLLHYSVAAVAQSPFPLLGAASRKQVTSSTKFKERENGSQILAMILAEWLNMLQRALQDEWMRIFWPAVWYWSDQFLAASALVTSMSCDHACLPPSGRDSQCAHRCFQLRSWGRPTPPQLDRMPQIYSSALAAELLPLCLNLWAPRVHNLSRRAKYKRKADWMRRSR